MLYLKDSLWINYAHKKHIPFEGYEEGITLDVKPSNILVSKGGDIKIIDYGISQGNNEEERGENYGKPNVYGTRTTGY